ncbi:MAG: hypothetical protein ACK6BZ_14995 [Candidatus Kapaibacterium sp.]
MSASSHNPPSNSIHGTPLRSNEKEQNSVTKPMQRRLFRNFAPNYHYQ